MAFESKSVLLQSSLAVDNGWHVWSSIWGVDVLVSNRKRSLSSTLKKNIARRQMKDSWTQKSFLEHPSPRQEDAPVDLSQILHFDSP